MKKSRKFVSFCLVFFLSYLPFGNAQNKKGNNLRTLKLDELVLPAEAKGRNFQGSASMYLNNSVKNKVLVPVNIWGNFQVPGLHYMPVGTTLIKGISLAGGPSARSKLEEVTITRKEKGSYKKYIFDLSNGGDAEAHDFSIKAGDTLYVPKDTFLEDRAYYTSLIGVVVTIISGMVLYDQLGNR